MVERALSLTPPPQIVLKSALNQIPTIPKNELLDLMIEPNAIQPTRVIMEDVPSTILELKCVFKLKDQPELKPFKARVKDVIQFNSWIDLFL